MRISWTAPNDNSDAITAYDIQIKKSDGNWLADLTDCNGADSGIIS